MSDNLVHELTLERLANIHFGDPDATRDSLIQDQMCLCTIRPLGDFLRDKYTILIGERGTGKTAIFELLKNGKIKFHEPEGCSQIIIPISESFDYRTLETIVTTSIQSKPEASELHHRAIWELLILFYLIPKIKDWNNLPSSLSGHIKRFEAAFYGKTNEPSFFQLLLKGKKKIGVKLDMSPAGFVTPDVYAQLSPDENQGQSGIRSDATIPTILQLGPFKNELNNYLISNKIKIHILIDRVDEFVVRDEYKTQLDALNSLLSVERGYLSFSNLSVKLFLRADLFRKLDLREGGADKIIGRKVELKWTPEEIREFLAKRLVYNYLKLLPGNRYEIGTETERIYLDSRSNFDLKRDALSNRLVNWAKRKSSLLLANTLGRIIPKLAHPYLARHSNFNDTINRQLLFGFFGETVSHLTESGVGKTIDLADYLETHFKLNTNFSTPRIMLLFLDESLRSAVDFYGKNSIAAMLGVPVIPVVCIPEAYSAFRAKLWEALALEGKGYSNLINEFSKKFGPEKFTAKDVMRAMAIKEDKELDEFLAVLNHLGILACVNKNLPLERREFHLPILFRAVRRN